MVNRRDFMKSALTVSGGMLLPRRAALAGVAGKSKIQYVRENIPAFDVPSCRGERYTDSVPDTLDIAERSKLAIHGLTSPTDPDADFEVYAVVNVHRNPVVMWHHWGDWVQICEGMMESLPLLRVATGDSQNDQVDQAWMTVALKSLGPDGMYYMPFVGRPWSRYRYHVGGLSETDPVWKPDGTTTGFTDTSVTQLSTGEVGARALPTLTVYYLRDGNPMWKEAGKRMADRLAQIAVHKDDYAYVTGAWVPNAKVGRDAAAPTAFIAAEWDGRLIQGLAQYYNVTGYEPALELAGKITKFYRYHSQYHDEEGRFLWDPGLQKTIKQTRGLPSPLIGGHGHAHNVGLLAMLEYAMAAKDRDTLDFVRADYEWIKRQNSSFGVSTLVGWFPEAYAPKFDDCEACAVADMLGLAAKLTDAGAGDYWDDLDRWVRNQFTAMQLTPEMVDTVYRFSDSLTRKPLDEFSTTDHVVERNVGAWSSQAGPTEWSARNGITHCCTGSSARSLYYVWEHMLEHKADGLRVNLLLNRASPWADVYSYIPYQGRVEVKMKQPCGRLLVRAPSWLKAHSPAIGCKIAGAVRRLQWEGRYVNVGAVKAGDKVSVTFPIAERTVTEWIGPQTYRVTLRGNTVVAIDPPGQNVPIYQDRAKYRSGNVQWRKVERFVPEKSISW